MNCLTKIVIVGQVRGGMWLERHQGVLLFLVGIALLLNGTNEIADAATGAGAGYSGDKYQQVCKAILNVHDKEYGALLTSAAGIGAIVASVMGGFKMAWACLVVSVGSFILKEYKDLFFKGSCG